jgi:hypothetical protein
MDLFTLIMLGSNVISRLFWGTVPTGLDIFQQMTTNEIKQYVAATTDVFGIRKPECFQMLLDSSLNEPRYVATGFQDGGYSIFDLEEGLFTEYSLTADNPYIYTNVDTGSFVYLGPTEYLHSANNEEYSNPLTNENFDREWIDDRYQSEQENAEIIEDGVVPPSDYTDDEDLPSMNATLIAPANDVFDPVVVDGYYTYVANYLYFERLDDYGYNAKGSCAYVALQMYLNYLDTFYNDNIIPNSYNTFKNFTAYMPFSIASYSYSPGSNEAFHQRLIDVGVSLGYADRSTDSYSLTGKQVPKVFEAYLKTVGFPSIYFDYQYIEGNLWDTLTGNAYKRASQRLNWGSPQLIGFALTASIDHAVIAYGQSENYFVTNYGWGGNYNDVVVLKEKVKTTFGVDAWKSVYVPSQGYMYRSMPLNPIVALNAQTPLAVSNTFLNLAS